MLPIEAPSLDLLDELAPFIDEPIADSSILPTFLVSRMTRQHVTVALGGDGGDELYGGYRHYQNAVLDQARMGWLPNSMLSLAAKLAAMLPAGIRGRNRVASLRGGLAQSSVWGSPYFDLTLRRRLLSPDVLAELGNGLDAPEQRSLALFQQGKDSVDALMRRDFQQVLPDDFLVKVDRASMANSLEVRTPFLDHRLVEHAFGTIPSKWKVTASERRWVQNLMAKEYFPAGFELNPKQGFSVPMDAWMRGVQLDQVLTSDTKRLVNPDFVVGLIKGQDRGRANGSRLFSLLMLDCFTNQ